MDIKQKSPKDYSLKNSQKVYLRKHKGGGECIWKMYLQLPRLVAVFAGQWPISCHKSSGRNDRRRLVSESQSPTLLFSVTVTDSRTSRDLDQPKWPERQPDRRIDVGPRQALANQIQIQNLANFQKSFNWPRVGQRKINTTIKKRSKNVYLTAKLILFSTYWQNQFASCGTCAK